MENITSFNWAIIRFENWGQSFVQVFRVPDKPNFWHKINFKKIRLDETELKIISSESIRGFCRGNKT